MNVYIFLATGFEEIEALSVADILRRANIETVLVSCLDKQTLEVTGAHGITVICDMALKDVVNQSLPDAVVLPGGMPGAVNLAENSEVSNFLRVMRSNKHIISAICAAPAVVLGNTELLKGYKWTCYPEMEKDVMTENKKFWCEDSVVSDRDLITSRGPGTAVEFAFELVTALYKSGSECDLEIVEKLKKGMLYK